MEVFFLIENFIKDIQSHCIFEEILKELVTCPLEIRNLRECVVLLMMGLVQKTEYGQIKTWERRRREKGRTVHNNYLQISKRLPENLPWFNLEDRPKPKNRNFTGR